MITIWSIIQMIVMLLVVIYLINISLKYLAKYSRQSSPAMQVIQKIPVTKTSALAIVKILDQYYVMSIAEQKNEILRTLTPTEQETLLAQMTQKQAINLGEQSKQMGAEFKKFLNQKIGKGK